MAISKNLSRPTVVPAYSSRSLHGSAPFDFEFRGVRGQRRHRVCGFLAGLSGAQKCGVQFHIAPQSCGKIRWHLHHNSAVLNPIFLLQFFFQHSKKSTTPQPHLPLNLIRRPFLAGQIRTFSELSLTVLKKTAGERSEDLRFPT